MTHGNLGLYLCLTLICGAATASSLVDPIPVTAEAGEDLRTGGGHERQLKQGGDPATQHIGAFEVPVNPGVPCNDFPRDAGTAPNKQFRLGLHDMAGWAAQRCAVTDNVKIITEISTKCRADPKTKLARSIYIEYKTISFDTYDTYACYRGYVPSEIDCPGCKNMYAQTYVNPALVEAGHGKWVITTPQP